MDRGTGMSELYYRFDNVTYSNGVDQFDNPLPGLGRVEIVLHSYEVVKHTPKGVWIKPTYSDDKRFIRSESRKKFACPTKEDAKRSFIARKKRQITIYKSRLREAEKALAIAESDIRDILRLT